MAGLGSYAFLYVKDLLSQHELGRIVLQAATLRPPGRYSGGLCQVYPDGLDHAAAEAFCSYVKRKELSHSCYYTLNNQRQDAADCIGFFIICVHTGSRELTISAEAEADFTVKSKGNFGIFQQKLSNIPLQYQKVIG